MVWSDEIKMDLAYAITTLQCGNEVVRRDEYPPIIKFESDDERKWGPDIQQPLHG
jgi:hypothetical protein